MPSSGRRPLPWRRWNAAVHRDVGYLCVALTLVYAVSGIAVNHIHDWNPSYRIVREERRFEPVPLGSREEMVATLVDRLGLPGPPKEAFRSRPEVVELFYEGWSVKALAVTGMFVLSGRKGLAGRGKWWVMAGLAVPLVFLLVLRWL